MQKKDRVLTNQENISDTNMIIKQIISYITDILCNVKLSDEEELPDEILSSPEFKRLHDVLVDIRTLAYSLNKGELENHVFSKGFVLSNLKALQANLRHLTWQTHKIADGDFSQTVDFLGEFSDSFNKMTEKLKQNSVELVKLATLDALTQIPNRRSMTDFLERVFPLYDKLCAFTIDIDFFKKINDTYGHDAGDEVLKAVTSMLTKQFRSTDYIARYGGEEFVAVLPDTTPEIAIEVAKRTLQAIENTNVKVSDDCEIYLTVSIGISCKEPSDQNYGDMLKRSDAALYKAKNNGRNQYQILC